MARVKKISDETIALAAKFGISEAELYVYAFRREREIKNAYGMMYTPNGVEYF